MEEFAVGWLVYIPLQYRYFLIHATRKEKKLFVFAILRDYMLMTIVKLFPLISILVDTLCEDNSLPRNL